MLYLINFKTYEQGTGERALKLAKILDRVAKETGEMIIIAVQPTDIFRISREVKIPVFAQHVDEVRWGAHTGHILPEAVKEAGASGTLLNHSEFQVPLKKLKESIVRSKEVGLIVTACAPTEEMAVEIGMLKPDYVALEPPELIGTGKSVSKQEPEIIKTTAEKLNVPLLVGAGVHEWEDVKIAEKLGAKGVLVASAIVKSEDPYRAMLKLMGYVK